MTFSPYKSPQGKRKSDMHISVFGNKLTPYCCKSRTYSMLLNVECLKWSMRNATTSTFSGMLLKLKETNIANELKHNMLKNPNWREAYQGLPRNNSSLVVRLGLELRPSDVKSGAIITRPHCLYISLGDMCA